MIENIKKNYSRVSSAVRLTAVLTIGVFFLIALNHSAHADNGASQYVSQINQLQSQNQSNQALVNKLASQATSYQQEISLINSNIQSIQKNIANDQYQETVLNNQIIADQNQISLKKVQLADIIRTMYLGQQMTTLEELATSNNLSSYFNKEQYRQIVQDQLNSTIKSISTTESQLLQDKTNLQTKINAANSQNQQLQADQAKVNSLLNLNQTQQNQYNQQIQANQTQIAQLKQEEILANESENATNSLASVPQGSTLCGGGYPAYLCQAPQDSIVDQWHMLNRECVSYTAYMAASESPIANMLLQEYNFGNADNWPAAAEEYGAQYGVVVNNTPSVGAIAIRPAIPGLYFAPGDPDVGHAMYVEKVYSNGTFLVGEYNEFLDGTYSQQIMSVDGVYNGFGIYNYTYQLQFIHFPS
jgi:surface antigen